MIKSLTVLENQAMNAIVAMNRKMKDQREPDWEERRYEIAKAIVLAFVANPEIVKHVSLSPEDAAATAVLYAAALVEKLKETSTSKNNDNGTMD
jgi:hypothetical protein